MWRSTVIPFGFVSSRRSARVVAEGYSSRWQAQGLIEGEGAEVSWTPSSDEDQHVAERTVDGVAVTVLRVDDVAGAKIA